MNAFSERNSFVCRGLTAIHHQGICLVDGHSKFNHAPKLLGHSSAHWDIGHRDDLDGGSPCATDSPRFFESFLKSLITMKQLALPVTIFSWVSTALDEIEINIYLISTIDGKVSLWVSVQVTKSSAILQDELTGLEGSGNTDGVQILLFHSFSYSLHSVNNCRTTPSSQHLVIPHVVLHRCAVHQLLGLLSLRHDGGGARQMLLASPPPVLV